MNTLPLFYRSAVVSGQPQSAGRVALQPHTRFGKEADVFMASDVDDTLLPWKEGHYNQLIDEGIFAEVKKTLNGLKNRLNLSLVTGRGLAALKELVAQFFTDFPPLKFIAVDNGKEIFINKNNLPTQQWLSSLKFEDQDPLWKGHLEKEAAWNKAKLTETCHALYKAAGFTEVTTPDQRPSFAAKCDQIFQRQLELPRNRVAGLLDKLWPLRNHNPFTQKTTLSILMSPDESSLYWFSSNEKLAGKSKEMGIQLMDQAVGRMKDAGFPVKYRMSEHPGFEYYFFEPERLTINKVSAIDFILKNHVPAAEAAKLKAVIVSGDSGNDIPMLSRHSFVTSANTEIPAFAILANNDLKDNAALAGHPRLEATPQSGNIALPLLAQLAKIDQIAP